MKNRILLLVASLGAVLLLGAVSVATNLLRFETYAGPPSPSGSMPTSVWVGEPDLSDPDFVRIPFRVTNPGCCEPMTFVLPGFEDAWGICLGVSVGLDWEVWWSGGVEYDIDDTYPWEVIGRMVVGWYPPDHDGQFWPERDDVGQTSGNHWFGYLSLQTRAGVFPMASAKNFGTIGHAKNDDGVWPRTPSDGNPSDFAGTSGGTHNDYDGLDPLVYGSVATFDATGTPLLAVLDCEARCCWAAKIVGYTAIMTTSDAILHGEIRFDR